MYTKSSIGIWEVLEGVWDAGDSGRRVERGLEGRRCCGHPKELIGICVNIELNAGDHEKANQTWGKR
jgi:hypothetical protein